MLSFLPVFFSFVLLLFFVWLFVIAFFFVKYLVCANRLTCLGVSQDYLGAGEKKKPWARSGGPAYKVTSEIS